MSNQINAVLVRNVVISNLVPGTGIYSKDCTKYIPPKYTYSMVENIDNLAPFIVIFAGYQKEQQDFFEENLPKDLKILFKGRPAHNKVHPSAPPGNVIIVVDKVEEQALPEVS